ncbi:unnamed protein product [Gadus morhua 'NCC']
MPSLQQQVASYGYSSLGTGERGRPPGPRPLRAPPQRRGSAPDGGVGRLCAQDRNLSGYPSSLQQRRDPHESTQRVLHPQRLPSIPNLQDKGATITISSQNLLCLHISSSPPTCCPPSPLSQWQQVEEGFQIGVGE